MSASDSHEQRTDPRDAEGSTRSSAKDSADDVRLSEEGREEVHQMVEVYEDKPKFTLPGTNGTISGRRSANGLTAAGIPDSATPTSTHSPRMIARAMIQAVRMGRILKCRLGPMAPVTGPSFRGVTLGSIPNCGSSFKSRPAQVCPCTHDETRALAAVRRSIMMMYVTKNIAPQPINCALVSKHDALQP